MLATLRLGRLASLVVAATALIVLPAAHSLAQAPGQGTPGGPGGPGTPGSSDRSEAPVDPRTKFRSENPSTDFYLLPDGRIGRVYGRAFSHGATPIESAERFRTEHAALFDAMPEDLVLEGPFADRRFIQPILWDSEIGDFRFYGVYYMQKVSGVPVHTGVLKLLVRNEPGYPLVLAAADVRPLAEGVDALAAAALPPSALDESRFASRAFDQFGSEPTVTGIESVIFTGTDSDVRAPRLGVRFEAEGGTVFNPENYKKYLYITDPQTGEILYQENRVLHQDIPGEVRGMATDGIGADICGTESSTAMPYARVTAGSSTIYANSTGQFIIPMSSSGTVSVASQIRGQYFDVNNQSGSDSSVTISASSGGTASILHNAANISATNLAEVNAYIHANVVRDHALAQNPAYPTIASQVNFPVNVNIADVCNAYYNGTSINFFTAGGGCSNTANSTVVYHEYGHHLINVAGSGQGAYGEGMSDCVSVVITDSPLLGLGFQNNCTVPLRNADNTVQYPCSTPIHSCGRVISGCVWDTREALIAAGVSNYRELLSSWTINSILVHTGTEITPQITIDFLTLDDDDADLSNGSPHYDQINEGFSLHNMAAPIPSVTCSTPGSNPAASNSDGAVSVGGVACASNGITVENTYARVFTAAELGGQYSFECINFGLDNGGSYLAGQVKVWIDANGGTPSESDLSLVATYPVGLYNGDDQTVTVSGETVCIELTGAETLVVTIDIPASGDGFVTFAGGSTSGSETWILSDPCGISDFVTLASIGFPNIHWWVELSGNVGCGCPWDLNGDGTVSGADLGLLLLQWQLPSDDADFDGDGIVDGSDIGIMLINWGPCG